MSHMAVGKEHGKYKLDSFRLSWHGSVQKHRSWSQILIKISVLIINYKGHLLKYHL